MTERILVIDDDRDSTAALVSVLSHEGYQTSTASSLGEALSRLLTEPFAAVVVGSRLSDEEERQLLTGLRERSPDIATIMLIAPSRLLAARHSNRLGNAAFLTKPVQTEDLKAAVAHGLEKRRISLAARRAAGEERDRLLAFSEQAFLEAVIHQMPAGVAIVEAPSFRVLLANDQVFQIAGMTSPGVGRLLEHSALRGFDPSGRQLREDEWPLVRAVRAGETVVGQEVDFLRGDGVRVTLQISAAPVRDQSGLIIAGVVSMVDVTQRKSAARRQAVLADLSRDLAAARLDRSEELAVVCRAAAVAVGEHASIQLVEPDESTLRVAALYDSDNTRRKDRERILGNHPLRVDESWAGRVVTTGEALFLPTVDLEELKAGTTPEHRGCLASLFGNGMIVVPMWAHGRVLGVLAVGRGAHSPRYTRDDLTLLQAIADRAAVTLENTYLYEAERRSRIRAEEAAQRTARLQTVTNKLAAAITVEEVAEVLVDQALAALGARAGSVALLSADGATVEVIRAVGYPPDIVERFRRVPVEAQFPLADCIRSGEALFLPSGAEREAHYPNLDDLRRQNGPGGLATVPLAVNGRVIGSLGINFPERRDFSSEERELVQSIARQCAQAFERARLFDAERRARAEAESAVKLRNEFLSIAAHELKTPLTSLRASAQLVLRSLAKTSEIDPATLKRRLAIVESQATKLTALVNHLLDVSRLDGGRLVVDPVAVDLLGLVQSVVSLARARTEAHRIQVSGDAITAVVDPLRIEQVLTNLLDNAIKYSPNGGAIQVTLSSSLPDSVMISVTDQGVGVPVEQRGHIFDRFFQAHAKSHLSGLGLGLYISRQIVELHGGTIRAEFPPTGGTRFVVTLPIHPRRPTEGPAPDSP